MECEMIGLLAEKLGIVSQRTIMKAQELMRLADIRTASVGNSPLQLTNTCQAIICLELASLFVNNTPVCKDIAVRLAGVRKTVYQSALQTYERILELQTNVTVKDIALQFGCMHVAEIAQQVLKNYEREMQKRLSATVCEGLDLSQPMFAAAAVCATCKKMKIKLDKRKIIDVGRAKKSTFDKLCSDMERHAVKLLEPSLQSNSKRVKSILEKLQDSFSDDADETYAKKPRLSDDFGETYMEDYDDWRRKILEQTEEM